MAIASGESSKPADDAPVLRGCDASMPCLHADDAPILRWCDALSACSLQHTALVSHTFGMLQAASAEGIAGVGYRRLSSARRQGIVASLGWLTGAYRLQAWKALRGDMSCGARQVLTYDDYVRAIDGCLSGEDAGGSGRYSRKASNAYRL